MRQMSVAENIFLGREPRKRLGVLDLKTLHEGAGALLNRLGIELDLRLPVSELTIAQQQLVEIAKALSQNADLIVMDEPSAILAGSELDQLFRIIASLKAQGVTVIYISHRLEEVFRIADEVTVLKDGELVATRPIEELDRASLVEYMVGRPLDEVFPQTEHEQGDLVLVADDIVDRHDSQWRQPGVVRGRNTGHRRHGGLGPHRAGAGALWRGRLDERHDNAGQQRLDYLGQPGASHRRRPGAGAGRPQVAWAIHHVVGTNQRHHPHTLDFDALRHS